MVEPRTVAAGTTVATKRSNTTGLRRGAGSALNDFTIPPRELQRMYKSLRPRFTSAWIREERLIRGRWGCSKQQKKQQQKKKRDSESHPQCCQELTRKPTLPHTHFRVRSAVACYIRCSNVRVESGTGRGVCWTPLPQLSGTLWQHERCWRPCDKLAAACDVGATRAPECAPVRRGLIHFPH